MEMLLVMSLCWYFRWY